MPRDRKREASMFRGSTVSRISASYSRRALISRHFSKLGRPSIPRSRKICLSLAMACSSLRPSNSRFHTL